MNLNLEIDEGLVPRIDALARVQNVSRELAAIAALRAWFADPIRCDFGDFEILRPGPELDPYFKHLHPDRQLEILEERLR